MSESKMRIREFISRYIRGHELTGEEDFFALGFVNSMLAIQLVMFVEKEFDITVEDEDLDLSNFNTINAIDALISRKTAPVTGD